MKKLGTLFLMMAVLVSCKDSGEQKNQVVTQNQETQESQDSQDIQETDFTSYAAVGEKIDGENVLSSAEMTDRFEQMAVGDTVEVKFMADVSSVCKKKGCWMNLKLENGEEAVVKFKDYEFFVPKDIEEKEVVVNGKAFVAVVSVEEQQHLAEDGGQSPEEIAAITEPKKTLSFIADGVLIEP